MTPPYDQTTSRYECRGCRTCDPHVQLAELEAARIALGLTGSTWLGGHGSLEDAADAGELARLEPVTPDEARAMQQRADNYVEGVLL